MNVGILHHDLEHQEEYLIKRLKDAGFDSSLVDVRKTSAKKLSKFNFILNRVFASVANRDCKSNNRTLKLLKKIEELGVKCINSHYATRCDYDKFFSGEVLESKGIRTPKTLLIKHKQDIGRVEDFVSVVGLPVIVKRNMGGRAVNLIKADNLNEAISFLEEEITNPDEQYCEGYIVQEYVESALDHDYRISVIGGDIAFGITRSLVPKNENEAPWIASASNGSVVKSIDENIPDDVAEIALNSTKAIKASLNEVDILISKDGPVVIENNPTPNYTTSEKGIKRIKTFVECLKNEEIWGN